MMRRAALTLVTAVLLFAVQTVPAAAGLCELADAPHACCQPTSQDAGCDLCCASTEAIPEAIATAPSAREAGDHPFQVSVNVSTPPRIAPKTAFPRLACDRCRSHHPAPPLYLLHHAFRC